MNWLKFAYIDDRPAVILLSDETELITQEHRNDPRDQDIRRRATFPVANEPTSDERFTGFIRATSEFR